MGSISFKYLFLITILTLERVYCARILSVAFVGQKSHKITYEPLLQELAIRGHQITILSQFPSNINHTNVRDILTTTLENVVKNSNETQPLKYEMIEKKIDMNPFKRTKVFGTICEQTYDLPQVNKIMREKFDLVIVSALFNECAAGFVHKLNTTFILVSPVAATTWVVSLLGSPVLPSFVPELFGSFTDNMTFWERVLNFLDIIRIKSIRDWSFKPVMEDIYRRKLNDSSIPSSDEVFRKASLVLSCSHFSVGQPRPILPDIVEVGGMHLRTARPLPNDLAKFADGAADHGLILFSFGSALKGSEMPEKYRQIFLRAFSKLKQKVIWKWETEKMLDLPSNVMLSKWVPQQDVLGHKNCKLFLTHGGLGSTTESIYHGVPMVGIPLWGDQHLNVRKAKISGYALSIDFNHLTEAKLHAALNRVLYEPTFRERVRHLSKIYKDQFGNPLERAVFWTEYILRHKGAPHLRSPARDLNFFQYHSLDVITVITLIITLTLYAIHFICRLFARKLMGFILKKSSNEKTPSKKIN